MQNTRLLTNACLLTNAFDSLWFFLDGCSRFHLCGLQCALFLFFFCGLAFLHFSFEMFAKLLTLHLPFGLKLNRAVGNYILETTDGVVCTKHSIIF